MRIRRLALRTGGHARPLSGYDDCGDAFVVVPSRRRLLVGLVDGLGHGPLAGVAARRAVETIARAGELTVVDLIEACHQELRSTRGAALAVLELRPDGACEFCGVGNVELASIVGRLPRVFSYPGIVGHHLRRPRPQQFEVEAGEAFCLHSDGVRSRVDLRPCLVADPAATARRIVETHGRPHDDAAALVVAVEWTEASPAPDPA